MGRMQRRPASLGRITDHTGDVNSYLDRPGSEPDHNRFDANQRIDVLDGRHRGRRDDALPHRRPCDHR